MKFIIECLVLVALALAIVNAQKDTEQNGDQTKERMQRGRFRAPLITQNMGKIDFSGLRFLREALYHAEENKGKGQSQAQAQAQEILWKTNK